METPTIKHCNLHLPPVPDGFPNACLEVMWEGCGGDGEYLWIS